MNKKNTKMQTAIHVRVGEGKEELLFVLLGFTFELGRPILRGLIEVGGVFVPLFLNFILDCDEVVSSRKALRLFSFHKSM